MGKKIKKLKDFFSDDMKELSVELAYLFGSQAAGTNGPISDYDLAVLFSKAPFSKVTYGLAGQLAKLLRTDRMDLVVLNHAPVELRYAVIVTGTVIYEVNKAARVEFEANTLSRYGDFLPILRRQRKEILEEHTHEAGIQRYRKALGKTQRLLEKIRTV